MTAGPAPSRAGSPPRNSGPPSPDGGSTIATRDDVEWLAIEPDESIRWHGRPRLQTIYPWIALGVVGVLAVVGAILVEVLPLLAAALGPLLALPAVWAYLRVTNTAYVVTTTAIATKSGVLAVRVVTVDLDRIQNTSASQHALGRLFGYGTISIDTAGGEGAEVSFRAVEDPQRIRMLVDEAVERTSEDEIPGTVEQWEAVLDEVRRWRAAIEPE